MKKRGAMVHVAPLCRWGGHVSEVSLQEPGRENQEKMPWPYNQNQEAAASWGEEQETEQSWSIRLQLL